MLVYLLTPPETPQDWAAWSFHHRTDHDEIRAAIQAQKGENLPAYVLDPIPFFAFETWLERNGQTHVEMNGALGIQGADLETLDPESKEQLAAWIWVHYNEHQNARQALGI